MAITQMALKAANSGECRTTISSYNRKQSGTRKWAPLNNVLKKGGNSDRAIPLRPSLDASIWVIKNSAAYEAKAGMAAALITVM